MRSAIENIETKVTKLKVWFEENPLEHDYQIEPVSKGDSQRLETMGCPRDMLLVLQGIGNLRGWSNGYCSVMDWWLPCGIATAVRDARCHYLEGVEPELFSNHNDLLVFGWNCQAEIFFYETSSKPWRIVVCDGLDRRLSEPSHDEMVTPWREDYFADFISIVESEVDYQVGP